VNLHQAIESIAHMRMELDLAKSTGSRTSSTVLKFFEKKYPEKYSELLQHVKSESQLKQMIQNQIQVLQGQRAKELGLELQLREDQKTVAVTDVRFTKRVRLGFEPLKVSSATLDYLPKFNVVVTQKEFTGKLFERTIVVDLETGKETSVTEGRSTEIESRVSASGEQVITLSKKEISIYDLAQRKIISKIPLQGPATKIYEQKGALGWHPLRTQVAFMTKAGLSILDLATGTSNLVVARKDLAGRTYNITYINNTEIFLASGHNSTHLIYDTSANTMREFTNNDIGSMGDLKILPDGNLSFADPSGRTLHVVDGKNLQTIREVPGIRGPQLFKSSALIFDESLPDAAVFNFENPSKDWITLPRLADFYNYEDQSTIEAMWIKDSSVIMQTNHQGERHLDIWKLK
jgi:hypothetical protein